MFYYKYHKYKVDYFFPYFLPKKFSFKYRDKLKNFLWLTKCSNGAFCLEIGGETDIRGAYCAIAVATITNLETNQLFEKTVSWILR